MRRTTWASGLALFLVLGAVSACTDRLPTLSDPDRFPGGAVPTTLEAVFPTGEFVTDVQVYPGITGVDDLVNHTVATEFDGTLNANLLAEFANFPDTLTVGSNRYTEFTYLDGQLLSVIPGSIAASHDNVTLSLWEIAQPWDPETTSWENASEEGGAATPWLAAGGTRGEFLGNANWVRPDTAAAVDTLMWELSAATVRRVVAQEARGLMITVETEGARMELPGLLLRANIHPSVEADTVVVRDFAPSEQTFVFTPAPPAPEDVMSVGGLRSDRTTLHIALDQMLPGCAAGAACESLALDEVSLNRVELLLDPLPVARGFRPVAPVRMRVRRVLEPELGPLAPLGSHVDAGGVAIEDAVFAPGGAEPVAIPLNSAVAAVLEGESREIALALLVEPEASNFGFSWFDLNPRLRFVYTLPQTPSLP